MSSMSLLCHASIPETACGLAKALHRAVPERPKSVSVPFNHLSQGMVRCRRSERCPDGQETCPGDWTHPLPLSGHNEVTQGGLVSSKQGNHIIYLPNQNILNMVKGHY